MANRKKASRKNKTLLEKEKYTAELSSRQLVIGVCILIAFGLACFMLGVIVGRFDPVDPPLTAENEPTRTFNIANEPPKVAAPKEPEPPQETFARKPAGSTPSTPVNSPKQSSTSSIASQGQTKIPPPSNAEKPSTAKPTPVDPPAPPSKDVTEVARVEKPIAPPKETSSAGDSAKEVWTVQIGVYSIRKNAAQIKAQIEEKSSFKAELLDSPDGKNVTVIVGKYGSLAEAVKIRDELSKKFGYVDSFPKKQEPN